jgi:hypothetical protein
MDGGGGTKMVSLLLIDVSKLALSDNTITLRTLLCVLSVNVFVHLYIFVVMSFPVIIKYLLAPI